MKRAVTFIVLAVTANAVVGQRLFAQPPSGGVPVDVVKPGDTLFQISSSIAGKAVAGEPDADGSASPIGMGKSSPGIEKLAQDPLAPEEFDLETRERLAELDIQASEEDQAAAEKELARVRANYEVGRLTAAELAPSENANRHAALDVKRAKIKLEGLKRRRAELEADAQAAVEQAEAEREKAVAMVGQETAKEDAEDAQLEKAAAEAEAAEAAVASRQLEYDQAKKLRVQNAISEVEVNLIQNALNAAKAKLNSTKASVRGSEAIVHQRKSAVTVAQHALKLAEARLRAAIEARDRLKRHPDGKSDAPIAGPAKNEKSSDPAP